LRRLAWLVLVVVGSFGVMVSATLLAHASSSRLAVAWMSPKEVSQSGDEASRGPDMEVDSNGFIHVIWMDDSLGQPDLCYVQSGDQGYSWSTSECIERSPDSYQGSMDLGSDDALHACWWERSGTPSWEYRVWYAQKTTTGTWSLAETVVVTNTDINYPVIREASEYLHVVWSGYLGLHFDLYASRKPTADGGWTDATVVADTAYTSFYPRMARDNGGNLHVVWQENSSPHEVMYISGTVGVSETTWSSPVTVSLALSAKATTPDIFVGDDDEVHVVFGVEVDAQQNTQDVYYARFPLSNTENISPTLIPGSRISVSGQWPTYASPTIEGDEQGRVHVLWNGMMGTDSSDRIYHALSGDGGAHWSAPRAVSPHDGWPDGLPTIATDETLVHAAWQQKTIGDDHNDDDIYYSHSLPVSSLLPLALKDYS
jgi:hypothetical protein